MQPERKRVQAHPQCAALRPMHDQQLTKLTFQVGLFVLEACLFSNLSQHPRCNYSLIDIEANELLQEICAAICH